MVKPEEFAKGQTTHQELYPYSFMSVIANMTPFSEFNQSPRNMYQCQMGKQTMGTPCHAIHKRADNKLYRINFPQSPLLKTKTYDHYRFDDYPLGTNACVAVVSYTGRVTQSVLPAGVTNQKFVTLAPFQKNRP